MQNPNLRSKMMENSPPEVKKEENWNLTIFYFFFVILCLNHQMLILKLFCVGRLISLFPLWGFPRVPYLRIRLQGYFLHRIRIWSQNMLNISTRIEQIVWTLSVWTLSVCLDAACLDFLANFCYFRSFGEASGTFFGHFWSVFLSVFGNFSERFFDHYFFNLSV